MLLRQSCKLHCTRSLGFHGWHLLPDYYAKVPGVHLFFKRFASPRWQHHQCCSLSACVTLRYAHSPWRAVDHSLVVVVREVRFLQILWTFTAARSLTLLIWLGCGTRC